MLLLELLNWNEKYLFSLNVAKFLCWKCEAYLDSDAHNNGNSFKMYYIKMVSGQNLQNIQLSRKNSYEHMVEEENILHTWHHSSPTQIKMLELDRHFTCKIKCLFMALQPQGLEFETQRHLEFSNRAKLFN